MAWINSTLLAAVQNARIFPDSKTFVDMPTRSDISGLANVSKTAEDAESLSALLRDCFNQPGSDLLQIIPIDMSCTIPSYMQNLKQPKVMLWAAEVYELWRLLYRKVKAVDDVKDCHEPHDNKLDVLVTPSKQLAHTTLLYLPYPFMIPGDRFRECYYWDSYWVIRGLIACNMLHTAREIVYNLLALVDSFGMVPNGSRTYYTNRSQPPLLSSMVRVIWEAEQDDSFLAAALPRLLKEHRYYSSGNKRVEVIHENTGKRYVLSRYYADLYTPRPESYREDAELCQGLSPEASAQLCCDIASAAESGWDFSSRWFADGSSLSTIRTTKIVPVDLNVFLHTLEENIALFATTLQDTSTAEQFAASAAERWQTIEDLMWSNQDQCWHDLLLEEPLASTPASDPQISPVSTRSETDQSTAGPGWAAVLGDTVYRCRQLPGTYLSNWIPLWAQSVGDVAEGAIASLKISGLILDAGIATSLYNTGQQWDYPNAWPPLQQMIIEGLDRSGEHELAQSLAERFLRTAFQTFQKTGHMHEKYDARECGAVGGGGEYAPQVGFGWTNGVTLDLLRTYGSKLEL